MCFVRVNVIGMESSEPARPTSPSSPLVSLWLQPSPLCKFLLVPLRMVRQSLPISPGRERLIVPINNGAPGGETQRPVKRGPIKWLAGSARQHRSGREEGEIDLLIASMCAFCFHFEIVFSKHLQRKKGSVKSVVWGVLTGAAGEGRVKVQPSAPAFPSSLMARMLQSSLILPWSPTKPL